MTWTDELVERLEQAHEHEAERRCDLARVLGLLGEVDPVTMRGILQRKGVRLGGCIVRDAGR